MKEVLLIKEGEIALKGLNRGTFEQVLIKNMRNRLRSLGMFDFHRAQSTIAITPLDETIDLDEAIDRLSFVFGIAAFSRAAVLPKDMEEISSNAPVYLKEDLSTASSFKVRAKRSDKAFSLNSPQIERELGHVLLEAFPHLHVDVHNPDVTVSIEIRDKAAYIYGRRYQGAGGIPVGTGGEGMLLLSGGIDSPVACQMMAKRGMKLYAVHFVSPPYTSDRALQKVQKLCSITARYAQDTPFFCVPFTKMQEAIKRECKEELFTVIMRRMMMRIAIRLAHRQNAKRNSSIQALVTGESLGQVASQTLPAMVCTDEVCTLPVLRPLIGMDKTEIVQRARDIKTYETSILPYEDCCTVFTPKHPRTRPKLEEIQKAEQSFDFEPLLEEAVAQTQIQVIAPDWLEI